MTYRPNLGPAGVLFGLSFESAFDCLGPAATAFSGTTWPTANRAIFIPFEIGAPRTVTQAAWFNGSAVSGNVDVGVYTTAGVRVVSTGSTLQAGTSTIQIADLADTVLQPGVYFMGMAMDNTTGNMVRWNPTLQWMIASGFQQMASAFPLPDPVTFANPATALVPAMTLALHSVI